MNTKELRIGNLFREKESEQIIEVIELSKDQITFTGKFPYKWQAEPIETNEEDLLKLGFENGVDEMTYCGKDFCVYWRKFEGHFEINGEKYFKEYIHELQNLLFALYGTELSYEY